VWNPATGRIFVTREVVRWDESRFSLTEGDMEITWDPNTEWQMPDIDRMDDCVENPNEIPPLEHGDENSAVPEVTDVAGDLDELPSVPSVPNMLPNMTDAPVMDDVSGVDDVVSVADVPIVGDAPSVGDAPVVEGVTHVPVVVPSVPIGADLDVGNIVKSSGPCPVVFNARVTRSRVKSVVNVNHMSMAEFEVAIRDHKLKCESTRKSQDSVDSGVHVSSLTENNFVHPGNVINQQADTLEVANGGSSTGAKCCSSRPLFVEHNISSDSDIQNLIDILSLSARIKQDDRIPTSLAAAKKSEHWSYWKEAIESELRSLEKHKTWISAPKVVSDGNARGNVVGSKWVFDLKLDKYGNILRYKARLVAQGFSQVEGVDYKETFAPVANRTTLRLVMSLAATMDLELQQMDVCTAFLNASLSESEQMFMKLPGGELTEGEVVKLQKCLYGLKQAPREWNIVINKFLVSLGYKRCKMDPCLYVKTDKSSGLFSFILLYVDDLIIGSSSIDNMKNIKKQLSAEYDMKDLGDLDYCLGLAFTRDRVKRTITIGQEKYVKEVLEQFGLSNCWSVPTPGDSKVVLSKNQCPTSSDDIGFMSTIPYREAVGSLLYIMCCTRPDIAFAVNSCARFMSNPGVVHWEAVLRIFKYLKGTMEKSITFGGMIGNREDLGTSGYTLLNEENCQVDYSKVLLGFSDANFGGCIDTRRSTTGYIFFFNGPISWCSKLQSTPAQSPCEAEYMSVYSAASESRFIAQLIAEIDETLCEDVVIFEDNTSAIALANHDKITARSKHIDIKYHGIQDWIRDGVLRLVHARTRVMCADALTKNLGKTLAGEHNRTMCG
jgi:hypothetical protein